MRSNACPKMPVSDPFYVNTRIQFIKLAPMGETHFSVLLLPSSCCGGVRLTRLDTAC